MNSVAMLPISPTPQSQHGLSLVELMISLTIGLLLLAGITSLIVQQSSSRDELEKSSRQIENGRYAMQILHDDIEHAGFYWNYSPGTTVTYTVPADPCDVAPRVAGVDHSGWDTTPAIPVHIYGYAGAAANPTIATSCGLLNYQPYTAVLVVRRTATSSIPVANAQAGTTYLQVSRCNNDPSPFIYGTGGFALKDKTCATLAQISPYRVNVYYISSCDICAPSPGADNIPTLKVVQVGNGVGGVPATLTQPLVEGIENIQFDFGIDTSGDGSPDTFKNLYVAPLMANADWQNVMAVRVSLLARNIDRSTGYTDTKSYCLSVDPNKCPAPGSTAPGTMPNPANPTMLVGPFGDAFKRHLYGELIRTINPSARRETP